MAPYPVEEDATPLDGGNTKASIFSRCSLPPRILDLEKGFIVQEDEELVASPASTATSRLVIDVGASCDGASSSASSSDGVSTDGLSSAGDCRSLDPSSAERPTRRRRRASWSADKVALFLFVGGSMSIFFGVLTTICTPYDVLMKERLKMVPGLPAYEWWATPPDEVLLRVYVFNITNEDDFMSGRHKKIRMEELGPYVFREKLIHRNVTFHENGTMTYTAVRTAIFLPEMNTRSLDDTIVVPNLAVLGMASYLHDASFLTKLAFRMLQNRVASKPISTLTVRDYLWNLTDPLLLATRSLVPYLVPVENMGILHRIYEDFRDEVSVFIGPKNERRFFMMDRFHGNRRLGWWEGESCDSVYGGTEGVSYHQGVRRNDTLRYFRKTLCRVMPLHYAREERRLGMAALRFELPDSAYDRADNATSDTDCFTRPGQPVLPSGLSDLGPCYFNFPIAASMPHFYSSPHLQDVVEGLQPDRTKHHSYVVLEPTTGVPMNAAARSQSNLIVRDVDDFPHLRRFTGMVLPIFWAEYNQVGLPWYISGMMYFSVLVLPWLQVVCSLSMALAGTLLLCLGVRRVRRRGVLQPRRGPPRVAKAPPLSSYSSLDLLPSSSGSSTGASITNGLAVSTTPSATTLNGDEEDGRSVKS